MNNDLTPPDQITGSRIKAIRQKEGLSQSQLIAKIHVSLSTLQKWERDIVLPRDFTNLALLCIERDGLDSFLGRKK